MQRRKICVKCTNLSTLNNLPNYVNIVYKSNKFNYAVMYFNQNNLDEVVSILKSSGNITDINVDKTIFKI